MKKLIFSFFLGLFLLTSSQQAYARKRVRPTISFDIESVISINSSIGRAFTVDDRFKSRKQVQQTKNLRTKEIPQLDAKFPFLFNYSFLARQQPDRIRNRLTDFRDESTNWQLRYQKIT